MGSLQTVSAAKMQRMATEFDGRAKGGPARKSKAEEASQQVCFNINCFIKRKS